MSQPQEPHRPFFPFGNPFRIISPKGSNLSPRLLSIVNTFEETLAESLRKLNPKDKNDVLSLSWMKMAMESLCATHNDIKALITDLKLPVIDWDEKWIDVYLDISVKLLDICNAFSSELTRLNQGHLLLQCFMHNLESNTSNQFVKARSTLNSWRQHIRSKNVRIESCRPILDDLVESLDLPKVKNSAKGKVLMRAMYGVKVKTVFICSVYTAAFAGSSKNLIDLNVPSTVSWAQAYSDLQTSVNGEIREIFSSGRFTALKELEAVETNVKKLYPMIENGLGPNDADTFRSLLATLREGAEKLSQGLDFLAKDVDGFFKIVLTGRDALLGGLRMSGNDTNSTAGANVEGLLCCYNEQRALLTNVDLDSSCGARLDVWISDMPSENSWVRRFQFFARCIWLIIRQTGRTHEGTSRCPGPCSRRWSVIKATLQRSSVNNRAPALLPPLKRHGGKEVREDDEECLVFKTILKRRQNCLVMESGERSASDCGGRHQASQGETRMKEIVGFGVDQLKARPKLKRRCGLFELLKA